MSGLSVLTVQSVLLVGVAGAAGAWARLGLGLWTMRVWGAPGAVGTLLANILGCVALGLLMEYARATGQPQPVWRTVFGVGFLGAFTTFSTFGYETVRYVQSGALGLAGLNVGANLVLGLGGIWLGLWLGQVAAAGRI